MNNITSKVLAVILAFLLTATIVNVILHSFSKKYKTETAVAVSTSNKTSFKGVYVRDEKVITYTGKGVLSYVVADGGKLGCGSAIAYVYADESDIEIRQKIEKFSQELEILKKIQNPGTSEVAQPAYLSSLIDEKYRSISYNKEFTNISEIAADKSELLILLSTMQIVTGQSDDFQERITELEAQIQELEDSVSEPIDIIRSDESAYFVSYADGYEEILNSKTVSELTASEIMAIDDETVSEDGNVVGKLINTYKWQIVGVFDNSRKTFEENQTVSLTFESSGETIDGVIEEIRCKDNDPKKSVVTIACDKLTYDLVQNRTEMIEMSVENYEGIRVPREAIRFLDDIKGVYVKVGEQILFKYIDVIYEGDGYVISKVSTDEGYLVLYDDIIVEGVDS